MNAACLLTVILGAALHAQAQDTLRSVVVEGTSGRVSALDTTRLDTTQLRRSAAFSMADILASASTLFVKSYGRATESTAEFRGTSPSHTQALWNGMKINSPTLGTVDFSYLPAYFVDEATLLHGASSLAVTGGGLGGAIDMRTKPEWKTGPRLTLTTGAGSWRTADEFLRVGYGGERLEATTRLAWGHSKNDFRYTNHDKIVDGRHPRERNKSGYFDDINALQELHLRDRRGNTLGLALWYAHSRRGLPFLSVDYKDESAFKNEHRRENLRAVASLLHTARRWTLDTKAGYAFSNLHYDYSHLGTTITRTHTTGHTAFLSTRLDLYPAPEWALTFHGEATMNQARSTDRSPFHIGPNYDKRRGEYALSASARWRPLDALTLSALLREEVFRRYVVAPVPALFAEWTVSRRWGLRVKASVARNYRYPAMDDLYYLPGGNPALKPEQGFMYDGGLAWDVRPSRTVALEGSLTAFDSHIRDWILWRPTPKGFWTPENVRRVHNYGLEISARLRLTLPHRWGADVAGNYALTPSLSEGRQLVYVPRHSANLTAKITYRTWALTYTWVTYSRRFTTTDGTDASPDLLPYYMSDIVAEKRFPLRRLDLAVKAQVNNLFDTDYTSVLSRPMAGRGFELFVEFSPKWHKKHSSSSCSR